MNIEDLKVTEKDKEVFIEINRGFLEGIKEVLANKDFYTYDVAKDLLLFKENIHKVIIPLFSQDKVVEMQDMVNLLIVSLLIYKKLNPEDFELNLLELEQSIYATQPSIQEDKISTIKAILQVENDINSLLISEDISGYTIDHLISLFKEAFLGFFTAGKIQDAINEAKKEEIEDKSDNEASANNNTPVNEDSMGEDSSSSNSQDFGIE